MKQKVAPLAGSVDRNTYIPKLSPRKNVAPLAGSVDRNLDTYFFFVPNRLSLPSRGAWIEIGSQPGACEKLFRRSPRGERG